MFCGWADTATIPPQQQACHVRRNFYSIKYIDKMYRLRHFIYLFSIVICLAILSAGFMTSINDCNKFKIGTFKYHPKGQPDDFYFTIKRQDSLQIESDSKSDHSAKYLIHWTSSCKYELLLIETSYPHSDSLKKISKTIPIKTEILNSTNEYYVFRAKRDNSNFILVDTIWIQK